MDGKCSIKTLSLVFITKWFYKSIEVRGVTNNINANIHCWIFFKTPEGSNFKNKKLKVGKKYYSDSFNFMLNLSEIFHFGIKLRIYYRYCLNIVCGWGVIRLLCVCVGGVVFPPIIDIGFLAKRSRPKMPTYLLRQPADQRRTKYSTPKNTTRTISCQRNEGNRSDKWGKRTAGRKKSNIRCCCRLFSATTPEQLLTLQQSAL